MKIIFCLPGKSFTQGFMQSWTKTLAYCMRTGTEIELSWGYSSSVFHCRNDLVSMDKNPELPEQRLQPFMGQDYDFAMWIDSDTVWEPEDIQRLVDADQDIISGFVPVSPQHAAVGLFNDFNPSLFVRNSAVKEFAEQGGLFEADFAGFAFILIKKGVFESMEYPWFRPDVRTLPNGRILFPSEDFAWCMRAKELGWKIYAHPQVQPGHQKEMTMGP